ncbi:hypothetical protein THAOC_12558 [Thalassiosira oceanica]|uniref:Uncharacterized protein n=1 Tax=Thalassiosira oceanica TaxID=159749 RepID=K0SJP3_THAOC|nr:hypothetical protein THAOC_12558 [Thalassiosira oceanica]|eukprot:EJK66523.1 hypothetical protein THAOC_12558 [Thalassiosira oceanica]
MIVKSSRDEAASPRPFFNSESTKHGRYASGMLLMLFEFAPRCQKLPLGVLLHALLDSFQPLAAPPRFSSTNKKDDDSKRPQWPGLTTPLPRARTQAFVRTPRGVEALTTRGSRWSSNA